MEKFMVEMREALRGINDRINHVETSLQQPSKPSQNNRSMPLEPRRVVRNWNRVDVNHGVNREEEWEWGEYRPRRDPYLDRPSRNEHGGGVKLNLPSFHGKDDPDAYLWWERKVEFIFDSYDYTDERKLKLVVVELCGYALIWWKKLKRERREDELEPIDTWSELKRLMRKRYVPSHYLREMHQERQNSTTRKSIQYSFPKWYTMNSFAQETEAKISHIFPTLNKTAKFNLDPITTEEEGENEEELSDCMEMPMEEEEVMEEKETCEVEEGEVVGEREEGLPKETQIVLISTTIPTNHTKSVEENENKRELPIIPSKTVPKTPSQILPIYSIKPSNLYLVDKKETGNIYKANHPMTFIVIQEIFQKDEFIPSSWLDLIEKNLNSRTNSFQDSWLPKSLFFQVKPLAIPLFLCLSFIS